MFVKIYRYKIKKKDFSKWKRAVESANRIYRKYNKSFRWGKFVRKNKKYICVVEIGYCKSKKEFIRTYKKTNKDKKIKNLWSKFLKIVDVKKIKEEEFDSV